MTYHSDPPPNGYVRISSVVLQALRMQHLVSEIDSSIALPEGTNPRGDVDLTGLTEWVGVWNDTKISVGWDWAVIRGVIIMLNPTEIRTNILVSEENGIDSPFLTRIHLIEKIESLPWTDTTIPELIASYKG